MKNQAASVKKNFQEISMLEMNDCLFLPKQMESKLQKNTEIQG